MGHNDLGGTRRVYKPDYQIGLLVNGDVISHPDSELPAMFFVYDNRVL